MNDIANQNSKPWYLKLHWQVLLALVAGVAFGWLAPAAAEGIGICDLPLYKVKQDLVAMADVMRWLDGSAIVRKETGTVAAEQPAAEKDRQSLH